MPPAPPPPETLDAIEDAARHVAGLCDGGIERAAVLYLDPDRRFLGRADFTGSVAAIMPPLRDVIAPALARNAAALILTHSHPSGCADPSVADLAYTRALARLCGALDLALLDHLIVTHTAVTSLRRRGLL